MLVPQEATPRLVRYLRDTYPFNPDPAETKYLSDDEYRAKFGDDELKKLIASRIEAKTRMKPELSNAEI